MLENLVNFDSFVTDKQEIFAAGCFKIQMEKKLQYMLDIALSLPLLLRTDLSLSNSKAVVENMLISGILQIISPQKNSNNLTVCYVTPDDFKFIMQCYLFHYHSHCKFPPTMKDNNSLFIIYFHF